MLQNDIMIILLLLLVISLQIYILFKLNSILNASKNHKQIVRNIKNEVIESDANDIPDYIIGQQAIYIENLKANFRTPYSGYLYINANYCELVFDDNSSLPVNGSLSDFYLNEGVSFKIINADNLQFALFRKKV